MFSVLKYLVEVLHCSTKQYMCGTYDLRDPAYFLCLWST